MYDYGLTSVDGMIDTSFKLLIFEELPLLFYYLISFVLFLFSSLLFKFFLFSISLVTFPVIFPGLFRLY